MNKRVLVTGAAGFIGAFVARRMAEEGWQVMAIDDLNDFTYPVALKQYRVNTLLNHPNITFRRVAVEQTPTLFLFGAEVIIHLAGHAGVRHSVENPSRYLVDNPNMFLDVLMAARQNGARVVYASSSSVYTPRGGPMAEEDVIAPRTPYAASKRMMEIMAHSYSESYGVTTLGLRFFSVYGPAGRPDSRASVYQYVRGVMEGEPIRIYGDPEQARDFTYIDDVVEVVVRAAAPPPPPPGLPLGIPGGGEIAAGGDVRVLNVGAGQPQKVRDVISQIELGVGKRAQIEYVPQAASDTALTWASTALVKRELGWEAKVPLWRGLEQCVAWWRENRHGFLSE